MYIRTCTCTCSIAIVVHPTELVEAVQDAKSDKNESRVTRLLLGAVKQLRLSRLKPDGNLNAALTTLARDYSSLFNTPPLIEASTFHTYKCAVCVFMLLCTCHTLHVQVTK